MPGKLNLNSTLLESTEVNWVNVGIESSLPSFYWSAVLPESVEILTYLVLKSKTSIPSRIFHGETSTTSSHGDVIETLAELTLLVVKIDQSIHKGNEDTQHCTYQLG